MDRVATHLRHSAEESSFLTKKMLKMMINRITNRITILKALAQVKYDPKSIGRSWYAKGVELRPVRMISWY